jgi:preprotein translocase subunit SecE
MGLQEYLKETRAEMKHVSWPTRRQILSYTIVVIVASLMTAAYLGVFDFIFGFILSKFIVK